MSKHNLENVSLVVTAVGRVANITPETLVSYTNIVSIEG